MNLLVGASLFWVQDASLGLCVPLPAAALSHLCWVIMLPQSASLGVWFWGGGWSESCVYLCCGVFSFISDRGHLFEQWSIVYTLKQSHVSIRLCHLAHALFYHAIACLNGLGSLHSPGFTVMVACLHHSHLTLSFAPPCFNQNLCSQC